jgi:hypothetical protein
MILPPMGFLGSALNMEAPSTCATTYDVQTIYGGCSRKEIPDDSVIFLQLQIYLYVNWLIYFCF